jgi:nitrogen regulatory protein P-II 1
MKRIETVIRPSKLHDLKTALSGLGIHGLTVFEAGGFGRQRGHKEMFRGNEYDVDLIPKLVVVLVTQDELVDKIIDKIISVCYTGEVGDGKIFVSTIDETVRIRTGERGEGAM